MRVLKVKVISLPYIFQVLYVLCFTGTRHQVSVYRTIGPLVFSEREEQERQEKEQKEEEVREYQAKPAKLMEIAARQREKEREIEEKQAHQQEEARRERPR